jgi:hypothetical protein
MRCVSPHYPQASSSADAAGSVDASAVGSSKSDGASLFRFLHFASVSFNHTKQTQHCACQLQLQLLVTTVLQLAHAHLANRSLLSSSPRLAPPHAAQVNHNHIIREFLLPPRARNRLVSTSCCRLGHCRLVARLCMVLLQRFQCAPSLTRLNLTWSASEPPLCQ